MATIVAWPITILITVIVWIVLEGLKRYVFKTNWPVWLKPVDVGTILALWSIQSISYQEWGHSFVLPMLLVFVLWGIAVALYQTFLSQTFTLKRFSKQWGRIINLTTFGTLILFALIGWLI